MLMLLLDVSSQNYSNQQRQKAARPVTTLSDSTKLHNTVLSRCYTCETPERCRTMEVDVQ